MGDEVRRNSVIEYLNLIVYRRPLETLRYVLNLGNSQWLSTHENRQIQLNKLRALIRHAYEHVPFYHMKFVELGLKPNEIVSFEDLEKLPILTRDDLRRSFPATLASNYNATNLEKRSTSGSTGKPMSFFADKRTWRRRLALDIRSASWCGYRFGVKYAYLCGMPPSARTSFQNPFMNACLRRLVVPLYRTTEQRLREWLHKIARFCPKILWGYPSQLHLLTSVLAREENADIRPTAVVSEYETLYDFQRQKIESAFNAKVFNRYGSTEIPFIAQECREHTGMHINAEDRIVEFLRNGKNVSAGEEGEIVVTDLENYAMPLIRYSTEDVGTPTDDLCPCGRGLPLIKDVKGRVSDFLVTRDGKLVAGRLFLLPAPYIIRDYEWIQQYQIIQESRERVLLNIVKSPTYKTEAVQGLVANIRNHLGDLEVDIQFVDSIPTYGRLGKHRFIISRISHEFL